MLHPSLWQLVNWQDPVSDHPLNKGRVAWWLNVPHWQGGTTWRDLLGRYHGTLTNMPTPPPWNPTGPQRSWGSLSFQSNDYVSVSTAPDLEITGNFSVAVSVRITANVTGMIIHKGGYGSTDGFAIFYSSSNQKFNLKGNGVGASDFYFLSNSALTQSQWYHCVFTYAAGSQKSYVDGMLQTATGAATDNYLTVSDNIEIGGESAQTYDITGDMDDVSLWNRELSEAEVKDLYQRSLNYNQGLLRQVPIAIGQAAAATTKDFAAALTASATVTSSTSITESFIAALSASAVVTAALDVSGTVSFGTALSASATATADESITRAYASDVANTATLAAALSLTQSFAAGVSGSASVVSDFETAAVKAFAATLTASGTASAAFERTIGLNSALAGSATLSSAFVEVLAFAGAVSATGTVTSALAKTMPFAAAIACSAVVVSAFGDASTATFATITIGGNYGYSLDIQTHRYTIDFGS
jgi:hypothetical protein